MRLPINPAVSLEAIVKKDAEVSLVADGHLTALVCRFLDFVHQRNGIVRERDAAFPLFIGDD